MTSAKRTTIILILVVLVASMMLLCGLFIRPSRRMAEVPQDESPLTINIDSHVIPEYYLNLQKELRRIGIEVIFQSNITSNSSGNNITRLAHDDMPDIITMWAPFPQKLQRDKLLDLTQFSFVDAFRQRRLHTLSQDGSVFQLPYSSKLIGIQYNKTMFQENGWTPPRNFAELQALIPKIRQAGYEVSTTATSLSGHGFNYLFHFAGVTALFTPAGTQWLEKFLSGDTTDLSPIEKSLSYLNKLKECGFFGDVRSSDATTVFKSRRNSAFYLDIVSHPLPYIGTLYDKTGRPVPEAYEADSAGEFVCLEGKYIRYDGNNAQHAGAPRFRGIGERKISDEYAIMPWFNEEGDNDCFCIYDNFYISLNRRLGEPRNQKKLQKALTVMEYFCRNDFVEFCKASSSDVFIPLNTFLMDEGRCYAEYIPQIQAGYVMPWYYPKFDDSVIVKVGEVMNRWLLDTKKPDGSLYTTADILVELRDAEAAFLSHGDAEEPFGRIDGDFSVEETARFLAVSMASGLQRHLTETAQLPAGMPRQVSGALMPYRVNRQWKPGIFMEASSARLYQGDCNGVVLSTIQPRLGGGLGAVLLTGKEVRELHKNGLTYQSGEYSSHLPYAWAFREEGWSDDEEYLFAVFSSHLPQELLKEKTKTGKYFTLGLAMTDCMMETVKHFQHLSPEQFRNERQNLD